MCPRAAVALHTLGDLPALVVNGSRLVAGAGGNRTAAEVTACDSRRRQTIATSAASPINGTFYLTYAGARTRDLPFNANASEVAAELNALDAIYACAVEPAVLGGAFGARAWTVHLVSVEGDEAAELYAEGHLLQGTHVGIAVEHDCPTNGRGKFPDQCNTTALNSEVWVPSIFPLLSTARSRFKNCLAFPFLYSLSLNFFIFQSLFSNQAPRLCIYPRFFLSLPPRHLITPRATPGRASTCTGAAPKAWRGGAGRST